MISPVLAAKNQIGNMLAGARRILSVESPGDNWWEAGGATGAVAVYDPIIADTLEDSYIDLTGNGNDIETVLGTPQLTDDGWLLESEYFVTPVIPVKGQTTIIQWSDADLSASAETLFMSNVSGLRHLLYATWFDRTLAYIGDSFVQDAGTEHESGIAAVAGRKLYINGELIGEAADTWGTGTPDPIGIGGPQFSLNGVIKKFATYDNELTAEQIAAITSQLQGTGNWWEAGGATGAVAVYQPIGADSLADSYVNLANPGTYDAAPGVAPTWSDTDGWTFNGISQYLDTGWINSTTSQDQTIIIRFSNVGNSSFMAGSGRANGRYFGFKAESANNRLQYLNGYGAIKSPFMAEGVIAISGNKGYRNGVDDGVTIGDYSTSENMSVWIGAANPTVGRFLGKIQAIAIYSSTLTAEQVAAVTDEMELLGVPEWALAGDVDVDNLVACYQPIGADSLADSYIDLSGNGNDAAPGVAPTWDAAGGWDFDGSTQYLKTGYNPTDGNNWTAIVRYSDCAALGSNMPLGVTNGSGSYYSVTPRSYSAKLQFASGSGQADGATDRTLYGIIAVAGTNGYFNGVLDTASVTAAVADFGELFIGAANNSDSPINLYDGKIQAIAVYNAALTADQIAAITNEMKNINIPEWAIAGGVDAGNIVACFQPIGADSLTDSYSDLSGSGRDAELGIAPTWNDAHGWQFDGSTQYLKTGFTPDTDQSNTIIMRYSHLSNYNSWPFGSRTLYQGQFGIFIYMSDIGYLNGAGNVQAGSASSGSGTLAVVGDEGYRDGVLDAENLPAWGASAAPIYMGAMNYNNSFPFQQCAIYIQALAIYDEILTSAQVAAISDEMRVLGVPEWALAGDVDVDNLVACYQPIGADSLADSYIDLSGNGNDAAPGVAPTWDAVNGWTFNGSTQYLDSGVVPTNDQTWSMIISFSDVAASGSDVLAGVWKTTGESRFWIGTNYGATGIIYSTATSSSKTPELLSGVVCFAGTTAYRDGVDESISFSAGSDAITLSVLIGAANYTSGALRHLDGKIQSIAIYNTTLSAAQVSAITTQMQAL